MFSFLHVHLDIKDFIFFTAASASPLHSGLYADDSLCLLAVQYLPNSPRNWGPPSVLTKLGQLNSVNHLVRFSHTLRVSVLFSFYVQA